MYISRTVTCYTDRIIECQIAQESESNSAKALVTRPLSKNHNRVTSVLEFNGEHIKFENKVENRPLLIINESPKYMCPESLCLSYWNIQNEVNQWENDNDVKFYEYTQSSIAANIPHVSDFTVRNIRFTKHIALDTTVLDPSYDYDFTNINDAGISYQHGPEYYKRPCGWYRKAIKVLENAAWLDTGIDSWPVGYRGTSTSNALSILRNVLMAGGSGGVAVTNGTAYGPGIYLSPDHILVLKIILNHYLLEMVDNIKSCFKLELNTVE
ncbi:unnamed protein product [Didymodactylos carnosus]|uniref:Uncharacterized protein n=1 Tax=Didymodactylos carnosus TaxID=1234261 RepID=A0A814NGT6_9BILA|nr:unnamed protein product [Didymodactylos carnosus]CAF3858808.1 unnamed protein product [Didymodactylos carnosus]